MSRENFARRSLPVRLSTSLLSLTAILTLVVLTGCEPDPKSKLERPIEASQPAHPAMSTGPLPRSASSTSTGGSRGLPAGHPPVGGTSGAATTPPPAPAPTPSGTTTESETASPGGTPSNGERVTVGPVSFELPAGLISEKPTSSMRMAQYRLPRAEGDSEDGIMTVIAAGGSVEDNLKRWQGQFSENPEGTRKVIDFEGGKATILLASGTFKGMGGPFAGGGGAAKAGHGLWGAVIETQKLGGRLLFLKATGPEKTIQRWAPELDRLAASLQAR